MFALMVSSVLVDLFRWTCLNRIELHCMIHKHHWTCRNCIESHCMIHKHHCLFESLLGGDASELGNQSRIWELLAPGSFFVEPAVPVMNQKVKGIGGIVRNVMEGMSKWQIKGEKNSTPLSSAASFW